MFEIKRAFEPLQFVGRSHKKMLKIPEVFRIRKSKDRHHNDQTKKENKNDLQNIIRKTKDLATQQSITDVLRKGEQFLIH